ncbi:hypothetical protein POPTR_005G216900v4 [Populus trichocarpa]|uniref:Uncharacterized protein n=2 Tax=Populus trichocarpa TaxID=3694 RepID=A0ACC0T1C5_POPTR|nr:uncharacterized protein LOC7476874 [Populus trichocarpa]XP_061972458.1 uncharacterized protein LOC133694780 [Populus nigra]KAI9395326.1 hypothetical protein POPTR_005G216900v4 [Populus trichocarpa]PNT37995.1 hypothetical protein POPTR_005G216900v4 [Populus trichocarpa]|eukprot:XP_002306808.1 uncharacterized protein LOC7476874 [Populus trichocarpa]
MPFPMKIQPIDYQTLDEPVAHQLESVKPVGKSRLKRLFERQFLRNSAAEKVGAIEESHLKDGCNEFEPSSVCLAKMVQNFIEDSNEKQPSVRCNRNRCNCFNGNCNDSSEDEFDSFGGFGDSNLSSSVEAIEILKSLVLCASVCERNLLADTARVVDKNKMCKRKDDVWRKIVVDGLLGLGYDASICKSRWEKAPSYPAGEYEYIDVIIAGERLLIDVDFRSEFEIARSTKTYKSLLQTLPYIFVGKADRLQKIIAIVSDAAKQSLKKKGMPIPPWRKAEYIKAKWLSPHPRTTPPLSSKETYPKPEKEQTLVQNGIAEIERSCQEKNSVEDDAEMGESVFALSSEGSVAEEEVIAVKEWKPPDVKPKSLQIGIKMVTGLASVIEDEP